MSQPRDDRQDDLFRPPLEEIINFRHPLVRLAGEIDWDFLARRFSSVCRVGPGQPPLPTRLVAGLFIRNLTVSTAGKSAQERSEWDDRFMRRVWLRLSSSSRAGADRVFGYCDR